MRKIPECLKGKPYPSFISEHIIFKAYQEVEKVFPKIGLANCKEKAPSVSKEEITATIAANIVKHLRFVIRTSVSTSRVNGEYYDYVNSMYCTRPSGWRQAILNTRKILLSLIEKLESNPNSFASRKNDVVSFRLPETISIGNLQLGKGKDLVRELRKLNDALHFKTRVNASIAPHKQLLRNKLAQTKNTKIVFSSNDKDGLWDIATMSMRGIRSCQRWGNGNYSACLIGSMVDPYAGILYLANGKTKLGSKMTKRAVVRFVINRKTNKPALMVERIYPNAGHDDETDEQTLALFSKFLAKKTNNKFPIIYGEDNESRSHFIPLSDQVDDLMTFQDESVSYRDSGINYRAAPKNLFKRIEKAYSK